MEAKRRNRCAASLIATMQTKNKKTIREAIDFLNTNKRPIRVQIGGEATCFASRIIKANHGDLFSRIGAGEGLIIDGLSPQTGNDLIQSRNPIRVRFSLGKSECEFTSHYVTESVEPPYFGHLITYPEALTIVERRREGRNAIGTEHGPLFVRAKLTVSPSVSQERSYDHQVFDISEKGVGLLVSEEQFDLLERIGIGERVELELYAPWTMLRADGTVRHKSKMPEGEYGDYHLLGIELSEKLEHYT
jgi:c-di-GMP-binding flagellar brake protein YcgR